MLEITTDNYNNELNNIIIEFIIMIIINTGNVIHNNTICHINNNKLPYISININNQ